MARKTVDEAAVTRAALINAAIEVFAGQGYVNATLEMIATKAGVSRGAVYWHFSGKRVLLKHILDSHSLPFERFLTHRSSFQEALQALRAAILATVTQQPSRQLCEIMLCNNEGRARSSLIAARFDQAQSLFSDQVRQMLILAIERGELHESLDVGVTCQLMRIFLAGLILECSSQETLAFEYVIRSIDVIMALLSEASPMLGSRSSKDTTSLPTVDRLASGVLATLSSANEYPDT